MHGFKKWEDLAEHYALRGNRKEARFKLGGDLERSFCQRKLCHSKSLFMGVCLSICLSIYLQIKILEIQLCSRKLPGTMNRQELLISL